MPTDVVANDLAIRLFLFGAALMSLYEGFKLQRPYSFIAWFAALLFFLSGALLSPLAQIWPIGAAWAGELAINPVTWFILVVLAYLLLRPRFLKADPPLANTPHETINARTKQSVSELRRKLNEVETALRETIAVNDRKARERHEPLQTNYTAVIRDYQNMRGLEARFDGALDGLKESIQDQNETARSNFDALQERVERLEALLKEEAERRQRSFYALQMRERLKEIASEIENDAGLLYDRLATGTLYDQNAWDRWESVHAVWNMRLQSWLEGAKWYAPDLLKRVLQFPDSAYAGDWTVRDDQFPNAEAVRKFKPHRIIHAQWNDARETVNQGVDLVAFGGLSDNEVRRGKHPDE